MMTEDAKGEPPAGYLFELRAGAVAITTGAWSDNALKLFGLRNYSEPIRRQICLADNRVTNFAAYGMIVVTSGGYFLNKGSPILTSLSLPPEPPAPTFHLYSYPSFFH